MAKKATKSQKNCAKFRTKHTSNRILEHCRYTTMLLPILILSFHLCYPIASAVSIVTNHSNDRGRQDVKLDVVKFSLSFCCFPFLRTKYFFRTIWQQQTKADFPPLAALSLKIQSRQCFPLRHSISLVGFVFCRSPFLLCRINRSHQNLNQRAGILNFQESPRSKSGMKGFKSTFFYSHRTTAHKRIFCFSLGHIFLQIFFF